MRRGSAVADDQFAYFAPHSSRSVFRYKWSTEKWEELPPSLYWNSGLVIINGELTAVGGWNGIHYTNKLFALRWDRWVEHYYPPMNIQRSSPAVVSTPDGNYILVIGGKVSIGSWTAMVEILDVRHRKWHHFKLTQILIWPSAAICGNRVHVIGKDGDGYSSSILSSDSILDRIHRWIRPVELELNWTQLPQLPVMWSTAATLSGKLIIVGGERHGSQVNSIHQLIAGQWVEIGFMSSSRNGSLVVSPSPDKMMIVGGNGKDVEECVVV